jgi:hypothetical protein
LLGSHLIVTCDFVRKCQGHVGAVKVACIILLMPSKSLFSTFWKSGKIIVQLPHGHRDPYNIVRLNYTLTASGCRHTIRSLPHHVCSEQSLTLISPNLLLPATQSLTVPRSARATRRQINDIDSATSSCHAGLINQHRVCLSAQSQLFASTRHLPHHS